MENHELTSELLDQFVTESKESIENAETALLSIEKSGGSGEEIHEVFRSVHTIKGSAAYLGLQDLKELTHEFESVLDGIRKSEQKNISNAISELFFEVLDAIKDLVENARTKQSSSTESHKNLIEQLVRLSPEASRKVVENSLIAPNMPGKSAAIDKSLKIFMDNLAQQNDALLRARAKLQPGHPIDPTVRGIVSRALQGVKNASQFVGEQELEVLSQELKNWVLSVEQSSDASEFAKRIDLYLDQLKQFFNGTHQRKEAISPPIQTENLIKNIPPLGKTAETKTVRVNQDVLDGVMNLVGELIVARNGFSHIQNQLANVDGDPVLALKEFREASNRLTHITSELQRNVMKMRMIPVKTLFQRYPRIVRDVCSKIGKSVEVVFEGEDTEIDKGIADQISEPLMHIVRNAVDHGIESPEDRKKSGKSKTGTLIMRASHQGSFVVIEIIDDGAGIDVEKVKAKAIENGVLTPLQAETMTKAELCELIFAPGFSTASEVTDISGRGVGLDVAKTNLKKIKGSVSISTESNQGTCFKLELPLTMAIMRTLLVKSNQSIYAVSLQDVTETVKISQVDLKSIRTKKAITLRGEVIMVESLGKIMGQLHSDEYSENSRLQILIMQVGGKRFGLIVDSVYKQEEIVIKPLPESYSAVPGLAGASILGDGKAILILDSNQLYGLLAGAEIREDTKEQRVVQDQQCG
jgi:two-component system chemotaxis sensor kinase CheA